ncbi:MAG: reverse transcriptase domain-containing protein [Ruminococcus sp.]
MKDLLEYQRSRTELCKWLQKIAIEPVFEADFRDCSYGFRPKRSARQALEVVRKACNNKGYYVVDADIEKFFDNVNQRKVDEAGRAENIRP